MNLQSEQYKKTINALVERNGDGIISMRESKMPVMVTVQEKDWDTMVSLLEQVIQVCYELLPENREREMRGLREAMNFFQTDKGKIVTFNQQDSYIDNGRKIEIVPVWKWLSEKI